MFVVAQFNIFIF